MPKLQIFATDICEGEGPHCDKHREEVIDLYWFEEEGVHHVDGQGHYHKYKFEMVVDGTTVWTSE